MNIKFSFKQSLFTVLIILLVASDLFSKILPSIVSYFDELVAVISLLCIVLKYSKRVAGNKIIQIIIVLLILGLFGNIVFGIREDISLILIDCFFFIKPYSLMLLLCVSRNSKAIRRLYNSFVSVSKGTIPLLFVLCILSIFGNNMFLDNSGAFALYSGYSGVIAFWVLLFIAILYMNDEKNFFAYYLMSLYIVVSTKSDFGFLGIVILLFYYGFIGKNRRFHWYYILLVIPIGLYLGKREIIDYLLSDVAPRSILLKYGFITANKYFPIGSGFATFGTKIAAEYYSPLYVEYGFNSIWGMSQTNKSFLLDSYYPQIIGQFGYIGVILFVLIVVNIMNLYIMRIRNAKIKYTLSFILGCWLVCGLGFNNSNSWSLLLLSIFPMVYKISSISIR